MRVRTWIDIEQEVEVEVNLDDVINELCGLPEAVDELKSTINHWYALMRQIPDELIGQLSEKARILIAKAMHEQAKRYEIVPELSETEQVKA